MKISASLSLVVPFGLPLVSAALIIRQEIQPTHQAACADICLASALADSVKSPRCGLAPEDLPCLCSDSGWASSYDKCIKSVCPAEDVVLIYKTLAEQCKGVDSPFTAAPTFASSTESPVLVTSVPASSSTSATASSTAISSSGVNATEVARSSAMSAASSVLAGTTLALPSGVASPTPTSAGNVLSPSAGLAAGLSTLLLLGYLTA